MPDKLTRWYEASKVDEIATKCQELAHSCDVYFGVGLQKQKQNSSQRGKVSDVTAIPGLWLDIDCQGGTHKAENLPTVDEARQLLTGFPLTPSIVVHSGGGLHAYWLFSELWIFEDDTDRTKAAALTERFQRAFITMAASHDWKMDNTSDLARVLRVPGTYNRKTGQPVPVKLLELNTGSRCDYEEITDAIEQMETLLRDTTSHTRYSIEDRPGASQILERCAFLRHCRDDADKLSEPEWYAMLTIMARTDKGVKLCHELSRTYPGYSVRETDAKIKHALEDSGPTTCERIRLDFPGNCRGCREKVTSPAVLGLPERWEPPILFNEHNLPQFPVDIFPKWQREFVSAEAEATQTPVDLAGMLTLSASAAAVAKKVVILIRPGWIEPLNLWTVTALDPGNRKSGVFADIVYPLEEFEQAERDRIAPQIEDIKNRRKIHEQTMSRIQGEAAKAKSAVEKEKLIRESSDLARQIVEMDIPAIPELVADDCSPEAVARLLAEQGGKIAIMSPEGDVFDIMAGRYSNGGVNIGNFLKGHAGDTIRVKRINRPPEYVKSPALTMGLAVQPDVLRGLMEKPGFRGRGLLGRFLYSIPVSPVGYRNTRPRGMPSTIKAAYHRGVMALLSLPWGTNDEGNRTAHVLRFSPEADALFCEFELWLEPMLRPFAELGSMTDWAGKLAGAVARISGILHMVEHAWIPAPWSLPIAAAAVEGAVKLAKEYLIPHTKAAYAEMGANPDIEAAKCVLDWIGRKGQERFSKRDLFNGIRGQKRFNQVKDLEPALTVLVEHGYIKELPQEKTGPGKPASKNYMVNPHAQHPLAHIADMTLGQLKGGEVFNVDDLPV